MLTNEQNKDLEFVKGVLLPQIQEIVVNSDKLKGHLTKEVLISIVYLKFFSSYISEKKIENLEQSWQFMNEIKGVIEKIFFVNQYLQRVIESVKAEASKKSEEKK